MVEANHTYTVTKRETVLSRIVYENKLTNFTIKLMDSPPKIGHGAAAPFVDRDRCP